MSWDPIELIMEIEEHFGVTIPDHHAERIHSVGDLYLYLLTRTGRGAPVICPNSGAFFRLRRTLTTGFGIDRRLVRPEVLLRDLFPEDTRAAAWPRLAQDLGLPNLPDPDPPPRGPKGRTFALTLVGATIAAWLIFLILVLIPGEPVPLFVGFFFWFGFLLLTCLFFGAFWIDGRYLRLVPVPKVRDLVIRLTAYPVNRADPRARAVWADLVAILASHLGVSAEKICPEHTFLDSPEFW